MANSIGTTPETSPALGRDPFIDAAFQNFLHARKTEDTIVDRVKERMEIFSVAFDKLVLEGKNLKKMLEEFLPLAFKDNATLTEEWVRICGSNKEKKYVDPSLIDNVGERLLKARDELRKQLEMHHQAGLDSLDELDKLPPSSGKTKENFNQLFKSKELNFLQAKIMFDAMCFLHYRKKLLPYFSKEKNYSLERESFDKDKIFIEEQFSSKKKMMSDPAALSENEFSQLHKKLEKISAIYDEMLDKQIIYIVDLNQSMRDGGEELVKRCRSDIASTSKSTSTSTSTSAEKGTSVADTSAFLPASSIELIGDMLSFQSKLSHLALLAPQTGESENSADEKKILNSQQTYDISQALFEKIDRFVKGMRDFFNVQLPKHKDEEAIPRIRSMEKRAKALARDYGGFIAMLENNNCAETKLVKFKKIEGCLLDITVVAANELMNRGAEKINKSRKKTTRSVMEKKLLGAMGKNDLPLASASTHKKEDFSVHTDSQNAEEDKLNNEYFADSAELSDDASEGVPLTQAGMSSIIIDKPVVDDEAKAESAAATSSTMGAAEATSPKIVPLDVVPHDVALPDVASPQLDLPKVNLPKTELGQTELPQTALTQVEFPRLRLPQDEPRQIEPASKEPLEFVLSATAPTVNLPGSAPAPIVNIATEPLIKEEVKIREAILRQQVEQYKESLAQHEAILRTPLEQRMQDYIRKYYPKEIVDETIEQLTKQWGEARELTASRQNQQVLQNYTAKMVAKLIKEENNALSFHELLTEQATLRLTQIKNLYQHNSEQEKILADESRKFKSSHINLAKEICLNCVYPNEDAALKLQKMKLLYTVKKAEKIPYLARGTHGRGECGLFDLYELKIRASGKKGGKVWAETHDHYEGNPANGELYLTPKGGKRPIVVVMKHVDVAPYGLLYEQKIKEEEKRNITVHRAIVSRQGFDEIVGNAP